MFNIFTSIFLSSLLIIVVATIISLGGIVGYQPVWFPRHNSVFGAFEFSINSIFSKLILIVESFVYNIIPLKVLLSVPKSLRVY